MRHYFTREVSVNEDEANNSARQLPYLWHSKAGLQTGFNSTGNTNAGGHECGLIS